MPRSATDLARGIKMTRRTVQRLMLLVRGMASLGEEILDPEQIAPLEQARVNSCRETLADLLERLPDGEWNVLYLHLEKDLWMRVGRLEPLEPVAGESLDYSTLRPILPKALKASVLTIVKPRLAGPAGKALTALLPYWLPALEAAPQDAIKETTAGGATPRSPSRSSRRWPSTLRAGALQVAPARLQPAPAERAVRSPVCGR